jgi:hypothetical protein
VPRPPPAPARRGTVLHTGAARGRHPRRLWPRGGGLRGLG